jgi:hypothetical protein
MIGCSGRHAWAAAEPVGGTTRVEVRRRSSGIFRRATGACCTSTTPLRMRAGGCPWCGITARRISGRHLHRCSSPADRLGLRWVSFDRPGYGGSTGAPGRTISSVAGDVTSIAGCARPRSVRRDALPRRRVVRPGMCRGPGRSGSCGGDPGGHRPVPRSRTGLVLGNGPLRGGRIGNGGGRPQGANGAGEISVNFAQGYHIGRPQPFPELV